VRIPVETSFRDALEYELSGGQYVVCRYEHAGGHPPRAFEELTDVLLSFYLGSFVEVVVTHFCDFSVKFVDQRDVHLADALPPVLKQVVGMSFAPIGGAFYLTNGTEAVLTFDVVASKPRFAAIDVAGVRLEFNHDPNHRAQERVAAGKMLRVSVRRIPFVHTHPWFEASVVRSGSLVPIKHGIANSDHVLSALDLAQP